MEPEIKPKEDSLTPPPRPERLLTLEQIKEWVDVYVARSDKFPSAQSGTVKNADGSDTQETWKGIDQLFRDGSKSRPARGLKNSGYSSLADFIDKNYAREKKNDLTLTEIKNWVDAYLEINEKFPCHSSGTIKNADGSDKQETWGGIDQMFRSASKGSPARGLQNCGYSSLADFVDKTYQRERKEKFDLTIEQIKNWVDAYVARNDKFPSQNSGPIKNADGSDTQESWAAIDQLFRDGSKSRPARGLQNSGYSSLADFIDKTYQRERKEKYDLTIEQIKNWVDAYLEANRKFPSQDSGTIKNADGSDTQESWAAIDQLFRKGSKGYPARGLRSGGYSSLADFIDKTYERERKEKYDLTIEQIKNWVDAYLETNEKFPSLKSGAIKHADGNDTQETWGGIDALFRTASKGYPARGLQNSRYSSLTDFIDKSYAREKKNDLTLIKIKNWVGTYLEANKKFPSNSSGTIKNPDGSDTQETWGGINSLFVSASKGYPARGLQNSGYSSLTDFIDKNYGREKKNDLTLTEIKNWVDTYLETNEKFPSQNSGAIKNADGSDTQETWTRIDKLFRAASNGSPARGLQNCGYSSLPDFIDKNYAREKKNDLTLTEIKNWVDAYLETNEKFPSQDSGTIKNADGSDTQETWKGIDSLFRIASKGYPARGLQKCGYSSLSDFIDKNYAREKKNDLTLAKIKNWVDAYLETNKKFPSMNSGAIKNADGSDTQESWAAVGQLFRVASKGCPARGLQNCGYSSLSDFIDKNYAREKKNDRTLTEIKSWVDTYLKTNEKLPSADSGAIKNADGSYTQETWKGIDALFRRSSKSGSARGLQNCGFSSLNDFLDKTYPDRRQAGSQQAPGTAADDLTTLLDLMEM